MNINGCEVCAVIPTNDPIFETDNWVVSLNPDQAYLGRCFVTLKQHKGSLAELTSEEWLDLSEVNKKLEGAITKTFGAKLFNWGCLMNNAFQKQPAKPHIHWHVRPRYDHTVEFNGIEFSDPQFGHHYDRTHSQKVSVETLRNIKAAIQNNLR